MGCGESAHSVISVIGVTDKTCRSAEILAKVASAC